MWRCELEKGCRIEWDMPLPDWELYQITSGAVRFQVLNEEFVARAAFLEKYNCFVTYFGL